MKKYIIVLIIVLFIVICVAGLVYLEFGNIGNIERRIDDPLATTTPIGGVACEEEAIQCPDGTLVGRSGPNCDFEKCPSTENFIQEGNLVFKNSSWYLIYERPGSPALEVKILTKTGLDISSTFKAGDRVRVAGDLTDDGIFLNSIEKIVKDCPALTPPGPNFCPGGNILPGSIDESGCSTAPRCI